MTPPLPSLPRVSVVVPVYNGGATIARCIESLLGQTYPRELYEVIVVDNNSTDDTTAIVKRYPVTLLAERDNQSSYAARNLGVTQAHGDIIAFTDSDCFAQTQWLAELVRPFDEPAVGAARGCVEDSTPETLVEEFTVQAAPFAPTDARGLKSMVTANAAVRSDALMRVGLFDESLPTGGDVDLAWRVQMQLGLRIADAPDAKVMHKHRTCVRALFAQYRRYGFSEILLAALYRGGGASVAAGAQRKRIASQLRALSVYCGALVVHGLKAPARQFERQYLAWPALRIVVEGANLLGKMDGLIATRFYRRNPFPQRRLIVR
jgi:glycosyltransferase involved in cell wall biosynthesis